MCKCKECEKMLTKAEIGLFKKLISKSAEKFMCFDCMAEYFEVSAEALEKKAEQYKKMGCTLFI